jgi:hypothetical protein
MGIGYAQVFTPKRDFQKPKMNKQEMMQFAKEQKAAGNLVQENVFMTQKMAQKAANLKADAKSKMVISQQSGKPASNKTMAKADAVFSDGFDNQITAPDPPYQFIDWISTTGTTNTTDKWLAMPTFQSGATTFPVHSGKGQAFIFNNFGTATGTLPLDAWLINKSDITLEAGTTYRISFWARMPGYETERDHLAVHIGQDTTPTAMLAGTELYNNTTEAFSAWTMHTKTFTVPASGTYHIGFYAFNNPGEGNWIALDDVEINVVPNTPIFNGAGTLPFGDISSNLGDGTYTKTYIITNAGSQALTIAEGTKSPEITLAGLKTVAPGVSDTIRVTLNASALSGKYAGSFTLITNDTAKESVTVNVTANVGKAVIVPFVNENFYSGKMSTGWLTDAFEIIPDQGVDSSYAAYLGLYDFAGWFGLYEGVLQTPYIEMGDNPELSFKLKGGDATLYEYMVGITADFGATWEILEVDENPDSEDFESFNIDVSEYADQTIMLQFYFMVSENFTTNAAVDLFLDDIKIGTLPDYPVFAGPAYPSFGTVYNNIPSEASISYLISNIGGGASDLEVDLTSKDSRITVTGLPLNIPADGVVELTIKIDDPSALATGKDTFDIVLETNSGESANEVVTIKAVADVKEMFISNFIFEDFAGSTIPEGWAYTRFSRTTTGGVDDSPVVRANLYSSSSGTGTVTTSYVDMGDTPELSFSYKVEDYVTDEAISVEDFKYKVEITKDFGVTWTVIDSVDFGEAETQDNSYKTVDVTVPTEYNDEICMARITFNWALGDFYVYVDNVLVGTTPGDELAALSIKGLSMPTVGISADYTVEVKNLGENTQGATDYSVKLMQVVQEGDDIMLDSVPGVEIAFNATKYFTLSAEFATAGAAQIYGFVDFAADAYPVNNTTSKRNLGVQPEGTIAVVVGEGTTTANTIPVNLYYKQSYTQTLYFPNELNTNGGEIKNIVYTSKIFTADVPEKPIKVWIGETNKTNLTGGWISPDSLTLVFDGVKTFPAGDGLDIIIPFDQAYEYKGGNLVVYVYKGGDEFHSSSDHFYTTTDAGSSRTLRRGADEELEPETPTSGSVDHAFPNTMFVLNTEDMGSLSGVITDGSDPIDSVKVQLAGSQLYTLTNEDGEYSFPYLVAGEYDLELSKFGYYTKTVQDIEITSENNTEENITMDVWELYSISGKVTGNDAPGGLEGVEVTVSATIYGENLKFSTTTDASGDYEVEDVYDANTYEIKAVFAGYTTYTNEIEVDGANVTENITLNEIPYPVSNVNAEVVNDNAVVNWNTPGAETTATVTLVAGDVWGDGSGYQMLLDNTATQYGQLIPAVESQTGHLGQCPVAVTLYDVFSHKIPATADPDCESANIVYNNSVTIEIPAGTYDFCFANPSGDGRIWVAKRGDGSYGVADDFEFEAGKHYTFTATLSGENDFISLTVDGKKSDFVLITKKAMNRAGQPSANFAKIAAEGTVSIPFTGEVSVPAVNSAKSPKTLLNYSVYRLEAGETDEAEWTTVGASVSDTTYTDNAWSGLTQGVYQYAVKANYTGSVQSVARLSNILGKDMEAAFTVNVRTNSEDPVAGAVVTLTNLDDAQYTYTETATGADVLFPAVWKGTYSISVSLEGFEQYSDQDIDIQKDTNYSVLLIETITDPFGLDVLVDGGDATLTWNNVLNFSDDVESYANFIIDNIGEYTVIDGDGGIPYGFNGTPAPTWDNVGDPQAWIVFNPSDVTPSMSSNAALAPRSGDKFFACFNNESPNNDWLILPKMPAKKGTKFSFYGKTYMDYGLEQFKVMVSTTGTEQGDFTKISEGTSVSAPLEWTKFEYDLNAYAGQEVYVAIVCVSNDVFILMVDDIFFGIPESKGNTKSFGGYSVYLNDMDTPVKTGIAGTEYIFEDLANGEYTAGVEAVYSSGTSVMETIDFVVDSSSYTGIEIKERSTFTVYPNPAKTEFNIKSDKKVERIEMTDLSGKVVKTFNGDVKAINVKSLKAGNYVIRIYTGSSVVPVKVVKQ